MDSEEVLMLIMSAITITIVLTVCVAVLIDCGVIDMGYVYENVTGNITDKDSWTVTTMVTVSTGKSCYSYPVTSTVYQITTTQGNVSVSSSEYNSLKIGDNVTLSKNLNTSSLEYICRTQI